VTFESLEETLNRRSHFWHGKADGLSMLSAAARGGCGKLGDAL
jgi:hypothetical protein